MTLRLSLALYAIAVVLCLVAAVLALQLAQQLPALSPLTQILDHLVPLP